MRATDLQQGGRAPTPVRAEEGGPVARGYARVVVALRYLLIPAWVAAAVLAVLYLPSIHQPAGEQITELIPEDTPAVRTEIADFERFDVPLLARTAVVQRAPQGLPAEAQGRAVLRAVDVTLTRAEGLEGIAAALPVVNTEGWFPGSKERSTTAITYLFFPPDAGLTEQVDLGRRFAQQIPPQDAPVGVTGAVPARLAQAELIERWLPWVEAATVALIALIMGLTFRSLGAPLVTLFTAGVAFVVALRVVAWVGQRFGLAVPTELEPLMVVLLLGIVTDYCVFFLAGMRRALRDGAEPLEAARRTTAAYLSIIVTAGLIVAAGTAALSVARLGFLRIFGPGLALTVVVSLVVCVTLLPALLGVFGRRIFWPGRAGEPEPPERRSSPRGPWQERAVRFATARPVAVVLAGAALAGLVLPSLFLQDTRLGFKLVDALPGGSEEVRAQAAAEDGFAAGILAPTIVLVQGSGVGDQAEALADVERRLSREPGVAAVVGPGLEERLAELAAAGGIETGEGLAEGVFVSNDGNAARYLVVFDSDPLGSQAIDDLDRLRERMPGLLDAAGLGGAEAGYAGNTALTEETIELTLDDLGRIAVTALVVDFLLLVIFLRSLVAPVYLLAASVLALVAALGLTTFLFQTVLGHSDITYYVPIAAAVLLVSLGSDYNVFVVGRIWDEARHRPLREAIATGAPAAARAIAVAAVALAGSFALLSIVPLVQFREFAFAMVAGVLLDAFLVRPILVPALIALVGPASGWPSKRLRAPEDRA